ncbi:DUF4114 domain-containing protein [Pseudoprimorskyibacter insulae]|uniref:Leukotoxin n=1 Tax=Pseudoprimorskyibacter insulae TaxID=1695997 RepID=A0A2R8AZ27_9RHOB|nr:DUF4114 domain-containing protein [Pseudoprimorskyibacter insulae]SPF81099.1 Leukotoxin [Pseudoprimorskyibacter insulae]
MFQTDLLTIAQTGAMKVTFDFEEAGFRNTIGVYKVDAAGNFTQTEVMWENASLKGSGGDLVGGVSSFEYQVQAGDKVGFFLIANGFGQNNFSTLTEGTYSFVDAKGKPATINSTGSRLVHTADNGKVTLLNGQIYHTAAFGDRTKLNADGLTHTLGYKQNDNGSFQIGFEDLWQGGDKDYDDAVFTVSVDAASIEVLKEHFATTLQPATTGMYINTASYMATAAGDDRLSGNLGADTLEGMQGNDLLAGGGAGAEWRMVGGKWVYDPSKLSTDGQGIVFDESDDVIDGGSGDDVLLGGRGNDLLSGGAGKDTINAGRGDDVASGGDDNDVINLEDGNDYASGGNGNDTINGGLGEDVMFGGDGNDALRGGEDNDQLYGDAGNDELHGAQGNDLLSGGEGNDKLFGGVGADTLLGGDGNDTLDGGTEADVLEGGAGDDFLQGGADNDSLSGGDGVDKIVGGKGSDTISGGAGADQLWGGEWSKDGSADTFVFEQGCGRDMIHDFEAGIDMIDLSAFGFDQSDLASAITDRGWCLEIDLGSDDTNDSIVIKSLSLANVTDSTFIL